MCALGVPRSLSTGATPVIRGREHGLAACHSTPRPAARAWCTSPASRATRAGCSLQGPRDATQRLGGASVSAGVGLARTPPGAHTRRGRRSQGRAARSWGARSTEAHGRGKRRASESGARGHTCACVRVCACACAHTRQQKLLQLGQAVHRRQLGDAVASDVDELALLPARTRRQDLATAS